MKRAIRIDDDREITNDIVSRIADSLGIADNSKRVSALKQRLLTELDLARTVTTLGAAGSKSSRTLAFDRIAKWADKLEEKLASQPLKAKAISKASASLFAAMGPECEETPQGPEQHRIRAILQWHFVATGRVNARSAASPSAKERRAFANALNLIEHPIPHLQDNLLQLQTAVLRIKTAALLARDQAAAEPKAPRSERHTPDRVKQHIVQSLLAVYRETTGNPIQFGTTTDGTHFSGRVLSYLSAVLPLFGYRMTPAAIRRSIQRLAARPPI